MSQKIDKDIIKIKPTKKGYEVILEGLNMKSPFQVPKELDGKEAIVTRENGKIIKIECDGKEYTSQPQADISKKPLKSNRQQNQQNIEDMPVAKAPYNFVPLNSSVVEAEQIPDFDKYHSDRYTGCIEIELKTLTPLYIRNSDNNKEKETEFFNVNGKYIIPGSSIRGMVRTLVEIMSFGKFSYHNNERLYYRGLADVTNLRNEYQKMISKNVKAGFLQYDEKARVYKIKPAVEIDEKAFETFEDTSYEFFYEKQNDSSWKVWSGKFTGKKKKNWKIYKPDKNKELIKINENDIKNYENDKNRDIPINLLVLAKEKKLNKNGKEILFNEGVPIFYTEYSDTEGKKHIAFGHTRYFRLPYEKTIGEHIPKELKDENKTDLAEAIFGTKTKWASRVFFEDAILIDNSEDSFYQPTSPRILSGPKPTTFQHYVEQPENATSENINHWNSNANIRGYKLYWHRKTSNNLSDEYSWNEGKVINDTQHTVIRPVKEQKTFTDRIRFENLSEVELGALLFALDLPANCAHKLGMGKPLGLGSVKITIKELFISDRERHYNKLFENTNWFVPKKQEKNKDVFKKTFENYVLEKLNQQDKSNAQNLWDTPRMKELKKLLDWSNTEISGWNEKTRYMEIEYKNVTGKKENEFKKRPVLPSPTEYVKEN